jgi:hypothetical protein
MLKNVSARVVLVGLIVFNVVAVGLSEVQRRALADGFKQQALSSDRLLGDVLDRVIVLQARLQATSSAADIETQSKGLEAAVAALLNAGRSVTVRLDRNGSENLGKDGRIICGAAAATGYLGNFIAGQEYVVRYDRSSRRWTVTGPNQGEVFDDRTGTCWVKTYTYGSENVGETKGAETGVMSLWGVDFSLRGLDLVLHEAKVGQVLLSN